MKNNEGKAGVVIVLLVLLIIIAAAPWYFIISRNLDPDFVAIPPSAHPERPRDQELQNGEDEDEDEIITTPEPPPPTPEPPRTDTIIDIGEEDPELFRELAAIASEHSAVAVSLTMFDADTAEFITFNYGLADVEERRNVDNDTKFRVASLAKITTVICAMTLVDQGLIDLDTDISVYLGYEVINTNFPGTAISTRMLMQHTSSIFDSGAFDASRRRNSSESIRYLLERGGSFRRSEPGTHFEYTNFGYAVLGAICENVSGKTLDTLARDVLFKPLGIDASYIPSKMDDTENIAVLYNDSHAIIRSVESQLEIEESDVLGHDLHLAQGNLTISTIDYARILVMLGNGGILRDVRILSEQSVQEIHEADIEGVGYKQGLGVRLSTGDFIRNESFFWHTGNAYGLYSQYVQSAAAGMSRGIVVAVTGAVPDHETSGLVTICTDLSRLVWEHFDALSKVNDQTGSDDYDDEQYGDEDEEDTDE
ncbi:MAG: beta-lactamase family protein [Oscillospiraceae bacterium]|nr:beta-lactamase family protein [Oscillospiraceae bacterium]